MTTSSLLDKLAEREQAVRTHANYLRMQIDEFNGQMSEPEAELADLATTRKVLLTLKPDEYEHPGSTSLPDNPVYQHILTVLADRPVRAKDLCQALEAQAARRPRIDRRDRTRPVHGPPPVIDPAPHH